MRVRSSVIPYLSLVLASACGGGGGPAGTTTPPNNQPINQPPGGGSTSASVRMTTTQDAYGYASNSFDPGAVTVKVGGSVTWTYDASTLHNATFTPAAGAPANVPNGRNGSVSRTFSTAGDFDYACTNHPGMEGSVKVVP
jgi:plastocyanin